MLVWVEYRWGWLHGYQLGYKLVGGVTHFVLCAQRGSDVDGLAWRFIAGPFMVVALVLPVACWWWGCHCFLSWVARWL